MKNFKSWLENRFPEMGWHKTSLGGSMGEVLKVNGGEIDIQFKTQFSPRSQSVVNFVVDEDKRGQGIGDWLVKQAKQKYKDLGAQVSSMASLKVFYNNGFRNPQIPEGTFEDHVKEFKENWGSLFVAMNDDKGVPYIR